MAPSASASRCVVSVLTPEVLSHCSLHADRSRPEPASNSASRSAKRVLPQAYFLKYERSPAVKASRPT